MTMIVAQLYNVTSNEQIMCAFVRLLSSCVTCRPSAETLPLVQTLFTNF